MKHIYSDKMDESDEYLHQTIGTHFRIILSYIETLTSLSFAQNLDLEYLESSIMNLVMAPSTSIFLVSIIILLFFTQTFDFWLNIFYNKLPFKSITRNLRSGLGGSQFKNVIYELKANQIGIYAIQGRRPHMEDNFSFKFDTLNGECLLNGRKLENLKRSNNLTHNFEIISVFDGHGGSTASNYAQENLLNMVKKSLDEQIVGSSLNQCKDLNVETISKILTEQILKLDETLCDRLRNSRDIAGTTALIALRIVQTNELVVANIGDSRGVLCDSKGNAIALSFDHKPNHPREFRRIYDSGGFVRYNGVWRVAGILACSRALGDYPLKEKNYVIATPDILTFDLNELKPKFAILASDGLFDFFSNEAAVKFVRDKMEELLSQRFLMSKNELSLELAKQLTLEAYKRGSQDNITVVIWLFRFNDPIIKLAASSVKEVKERRTKKADELEESQSRHRSRMERKMMVNANSEFTKEITQQTEVVTKLLGFEPVEFVVSDLLETTETDQTESNNEVPQEQASRNEAPKEAVTPKKCDKKEEKKCKKKFNLLNLELNLKSSAEPKSGAESSEPDKQCERDEKTSQSNLENGRTSSENGKVLSGELDGDATQTAMDKNANYEVRLKDEYNLVGHCSPKKPRSPSKLKAEPATGEDEFFDCK